MADYYTLLTNAGIAYETACKAAGLPIKLSQISVGDGSGAVYNPAATATSLKREVWRGPLNALFQDEKNPSWLLAEVTIPPEEGGWYVREAGIWTDTGILYAIVKYPESFKPVLATSGSGKEFYIRSIFETSNASEVKLLIDDTVVNATRAWVLGYVADELTKLDSKQSVRLTTTANIVLSGAQQVDGVAAVAGDRVGVVRQAATQDNGIWVVANGPWMRATDASSRQKVTPGLSFFVEEGVQNAGTTWQLITKAPVVLGTTALAFEAVTGRTGVGAGTYRSLTVDKNGRVIAATNPTTLAESGITDGVTRTLFAEAMGGVVSKSGATLSGALTLTNGTEDSPEFGFKTPSTEAYFDLYNKNLRFFARSDGVDSTPFLLNIPSKEAYVFGSAVWNTTNFNPASKVEGDWVSTAGLASNDEKPPYFKRKSDGKLCMLQPTLGFQPIQQGGGVGQSTNKISIGWSSQGLKATVDNLDLGLLWNENNFRPTEYIKLGTAVPSGSAPQFSSFQVGAMATMAGSSGGLEVNSGPANGTPSAALMQFHRPGSFGVNFGLDTDNQLKVGGWSMGQVAHTIWHAGNRPKDTALLSTNGWSKNADTGEIKQWFEYAQGDYPASLVLNITWPFQFPNQVINAKFSLKMPNGQTQCATQVSYSSATVTGCTLRLEEWGGAIQTGMVIVVEVRGV